MPESSWFTEKDLQRIEAAVKASEKGTSGEIVPVFVEQAGEYPEAAPRSAFMGMCLALAGFLLWDLLIPSWNVESPLLITLILLSGALLLWTVSRFTPAWRRWMIGKEALSQQALAKSDQWFLREEVFKTRHRTGIMIFVAKFEHQVIVKADKGISKLVEQDEWEHIVKDLVGAIRSKSYTDGIVKAINDCSTLLQQKGIEALPDDTDELSNSLRME
ncbi:MAG: hypothetical protein NWR72_02215 [Bacteroidia bacterium]|nr:hypothetical protein [Bacteroidia bacterium]